MDSLLRRLCGSLQSKKNASKISHEHVHSLLYAAHTYYAYIICDGHCSRPLIFKRKQNFIDNVIPGEISWEEDM